MKDFIIALLLVAFLSPVYGNSPIIIREQIRWEESPFVRGNGETRMESWSFAGAVISDEYPDLPFVIKSFPVNGPGNLRIQIISARYEPFDRNRSLNDHQLSEQLIFKTSVDREGSRYSGKIAFVPIIRTGAGFERLTEIELQVTFESRPVVSLRGPQNTRNSVLSDGQIYKIAVTQTGIHRLSYNFLKDELGIDIDNIDPRKIKIYGNGGGMLPENIEEDRVDDLAENPVFVSGEEDGRFNSGDFILFYAEGPDVWQYDREKKIFDRPANIFDLENYYFIKIGGEDGLRLREQASLSSTAFTTNSFDDFARFEEDQVNLLHDFRPLTQGSGPRWFGDHFKNLREYRYNQLFGFPNLLTSEPAKVKIEMALRATRSSRFNADVNGTRLESTAAGRVSDLNGNEVSYADTATVLADVIPGRPEFDFTISYPHPEGAGDGSEAWLDYIQVNVRRQLVLSGDQMSFRDTRTLDYPSATFRLGGVNDQTVVWDITDPRSPKVQLFEILGNQLSFGINTDRLRTFLAFQPNAGFFSPEAIGPVNNQNLHAVDEVDMIIVSHPDFADEARRLADHRRDHNGFEVSIALTDQIYNEFSSGRVDPTAIRDFVRMVKERTDRFNYLLLLGDGSFDCRDIYGLGSNFIPVYETDSFNPIFSFPSDDYYALLNDPGDSPLSGGLDIAIGRIPVKTAGEARGVIDKIINYDTNPKALGDWRNRIVFVGDDEDNMRHTAQADEISDTLSTRYNFLNIDKIYLDAFNQVSTPGGTRYPEATEAINQSVFKGTLALTYLGHGGSGGWAAERVLSIPDILNWTNFDQPPLLITATCSFAGYDDPAFVTAGEEAILNAQGGAIALLTTVRAVFSSFNKALTEQVMNTLFEQPDGRPQTIGEVMTRAKNRLTSSGVLTNSRKFTLLGDPAMFVAQPAFQIKTTRINTENITPDRLDTLGALQRVTVEGQILGFDGQLLESFNGTLSSIVFDKRITVKTLGQDAGSFEFAYKIQKNVIFKGRATVQKGQFQFTFVVPKDINYELGRGKISYYASNDVTLSDATGAYENIIIGGADPNASPDDQGPMVNVYMNTEDFAFGGITNESPTLLVVLEDDNGINVVGNSIGHDLEAILDDDTQNTILLNDFYESTIDDYRQGTVRFPLSKMEEGRHTIRVKAWDVANNSAEGYTEFVVASSGKIALEHVLNYPNPFTDRTCFQFDHNLANQELEVQIQIFTITGRLIKTLEQTIFSDGAIRLDNCIEWDGRDDFGDPLARGVYLYKVRVRANNTGNAELKGESEFEKLVLLK